MPEIVSNFFGRARNETAADVAPVATEPAPAPAFPATDEIDTTEAPPTDEAPADEALADEAPADEAPADDTADEDVEPAADTAADEAAEDGVTAGEADAEGADLPEAPEARPAAGGRGNTTVADAVVKKVVTLTAAKIDGVHSLDEDLSIELADEVATIRVPLVVEFGHPVKALAEQMRVAVIEAVEGILGLDVASVDVHVSDIHLTED